MKKMRTPIALLTRPKAEGNGEKFVVPIQASVSINFEDIFKSKRSGSGPVDQAGLSTSGRAATSSRAGVRPGVWLDDRRGG